MATIQLLTFALFMIAANACRPSEFTIAKASGSNEVTTENPIFEEAQVDEHFSEQLSTMPVVRDGSSSLFCVDARGDEPMVGTPGGDMAEFIGALSVYYDVTNENATLGNIRAQLRSFMNERITESRPFYFHTDETKLKLALKAISDRVGRRVTILPRTEPPKSEIEIWLDELSRGIHQGCGHIRLMIDQFADYGLTSDEVPRRAIQALYSEWWRASDQGKRKFDLVLKFGKLEGRAVVVVQAAEGSKKCANRSPAVVPNFFGSSVFVYTPEAADAFRKDVLSRHFASKTKAIRREEFYTRINSLHATQLNATLTLLSPANTVNIFTAATKISRD